jgi:hypothetical protein
MTASSRLEVAARVMSGGLNGCLAVAGLFLLPVLAGVALGGPPSGADPNSPLGLWYRSLTTPLSGASCCSVADCRPVDARLIGEGWEIHVNGVWIPVSPYVVLKRNNPDGRPIACLRPGIILCFVPPAESLRRKRSTVHLRPAAERIL